MTYSVDVMLAKPVYKILYTVDVEMNGNAFEKKKSVYNKNP